MAKKAKVTVARVQVYKRDDGWRFRAKAGNGEVVAIGEAYKSKRDAVAAAEAIAGDAPVEVFG